MFRAIISPILRSIRLWYNAPTMLPAGSIVGVFLPQSSAPENGRNYRPKHVELIEINNKLLLLHLVVVYIIVSVMHGHTDTKLRKKER